MMKIQVQAEQPAVFVEVTDVVVMEVCSALSAAGLSICLTSELSEDSQSNAVVCDGRRSPRYLTIIEELEKIAVLY